jgi:macrolide-specific efflux system membrane fusion protein
MLAVHDAQVLLIQNTTIASPIAGLVCGVEVREGDQVAAQGVLMRMDARRAQAELMASQAVLQASEIQAENDVNTRYAERSLEVRQRELEQSNEANERFAGSVTSTEIDRLQLVIDQAELSVEQSEQERKVASATAAEKRAAVELARLRVAEHTVESIVAGQVAEVLVQVGQWVEPGTPIVRLISLDPIRVSGFVDGQLHDTSLVGRDVKFEIKPSAKRTAVNTTGKLESRLDEFESGGDKPLLFSGKVTFVSDELNPVTSQVRVWAEIANPSGQARPGMRGTLVIQE